LLDSAPARGFGWRAVGLARPRCYVTASSPRVASSAHRSRSRLLIVAAHGRIVVRGHVSVDPVSGRVFQRML